ncbi:DUF2971 domain-containing protein [Pseudobutyrivibrio sp.]|uniref:DUF2971 domain-containing protein n=1 Tax=Pseudobutyrivibrio sp. TaxID=2014367 RepID=UPI001D7215BC|nr:DUF2971 domain-containing protein [Pseudobutyrivibrio sp.]MBE5910119.1 DUF2971 domain-containing protein [Pseudobutyrivibrio sp.]
MEIKTSYKYKAEFKKLISGECWITDDKMMNHFGSMTDHCDLRGTKSFYRYRSFNEYTLGEIINQQVYLAKLSEYDDAYEGRYLVDEFDLKNNINQFDVDRINNFYRENVRCACFTTNNKNIPMWYYYADKHQGICIEYKYRDFRLNEDAIFLPIIYPRNYEEHDFKFLPKIEEQYKFGAIVTSLVKNRLWDFENEWRILKVTDEKNPLYVPLKMDKIHLGANVSQATKEVIKNVIEKNNLDIKLKEMVLTTSGLASFDEGIIPEDHKTRL